MFSRKSGTTSKQAKLREAIERFFADGPAKVVTGSRLYSYSKAASIDDLALVLTDLVRDGKLEQLVRVEFEGNAVETFPSIWEVPSQIVDPSSMQLRWVDPVEDCRVVYRRPS